MTDTSPAGISPWEERMSKQRYSAEFRDEAIRQILKAGRSSSEVAVNVY